MQNLVGYVQTFAYYEQGSLLISEMLLLIMYWEAYELGNTFAKP